MVHDVWTFFIHGIWDQLDPELKLFHTVFPGTRDITATTALSLVTFGAKEINGRREMGWAGSVVKKGAFATGPGQSDNIPVGTDWNRNGVRINRCVFVTYQLSVAFGEAVALCSLYFHEPPPARTVGRATARLVTKASTRHAIVYDKKSGVATTAHSITFLPGAREVADTMLAREIRKCAARDVGGVERNLGVHFHDAENLVFAAGTRVDAKSGEVSFGNPRHTHRVKP